jgi:AAA15 family ATPase/GTPase
LLTKLIIGDSSISINFKVIDMITKVELVNFKRYPQKNIDLKPRVLQVLAGANNSGKTTILHALAVWEYCKTLHFYERGSIFFNDERSIGINIDDFTPLNIPNLKYLWTSLSTGTTYNMSIKVFWHLADQEHFLKFGFAYAQERIYIKVEEHNLNNQTVLPKIAYLPPFAGVLSKEAWVSKAQRNRLIGQGLAGSVIRNLIIDFYSQHKENRQLYSDDRGRITQVGWDYLKENDPLEILNRNLHEVFTSYLFPKEFNPDFHSYISIEMQKGTLPSNKFYPHKGYSKRDIMSEGSGFLQWLSVFTFSLDKSINVLLLDEPDAHLHTSLQWQLFERLVKLSEKNQQQVLFATHSSEIIKRINPNIILKVDGNKISFLSEERQKVALLAGLGTEHNLLFDQIQKKKRILFVENESDRDLLIVWTAKLGLKWPGNLYVWGYANKHKQRKELFSHLKDHLDSLKCLSLQDKDNDEYATTNKNLSDRSFKDSNTNGKEFRCRKWRRWEIENYLICPSAIALATNKTEEEIRQKIAQSNGIAIPTTNYTVSNRESQIQPMFDVEGKTVIEPICAEYGITKIDIANAMTQEQIFEDVSTLITEIIQMCAS